MWSVFKNGKQVILKKSDSLDISNIFWKFDRQCFVEKSVFDIEKYLMQELTIKVDLIDDVGPRNVFFKPSCETTDEFKSLPIGLPFLRSFLVNPKLYLLPFLQS